MLFSGQLRVRLFLFFFNHLYLSFIQLFDNSSRLTQAHLKFGVIQDLDLHPNRRRNAGESRRARHGLLARKPPGHGAVAVHHSEMGLLELQMEMAHEDIMYLEY